MSNVNVKWPGQYIADDSNHRLVTDEQIERWNKVDRFLNEEYIELTPENIGQYTCTKEDEYWTDMGLADGTIFDSSSLDEGNYVIKLGMDKLIKNPALTGVSFRFGKEGYTYADYLKDQITDGNGNLIEDYEEVENVLINSLNYQAYVNYTIDTQTFIFLCQFFGLELSLTDLLDKIKSDYDKQIVLVTNMDNREYNKCLNNIICWPEGIRIKIVKEQYGPENNIYALKKYVFFDMNQIDYFNCYNYKFIGADDFPSGDYDPSTIPDIWEPCEFTGVPIRNIIIGNSTIPYYTTEFSTKTPREYKVVIDSSVYERKPEYTSSAFFNFDQLTIGSSIADNNKEGKCEITINEDGIITYDSTSCPNANAQGDYLGTSCHSILDYGHLCFYDYGGYLIENNYQQRSSLDINSLQITYYDGNNSLYSGTYRYDSIRFWRRSGTNVDTFFSVSETSGIQGKLYRSLNIKLNDTTTYSYNNTETVEIDLSTLSQTNVITDWNSVITNGEYKSEPSESSNAPESTKSYVGTVVCGTTSITQKLYVDSDDLTEIVEYIRRGKIDSSDNTVVTWSDWYKIDFKAPVME